MKRFRMKIVQSLVMVLALAVSSTAFAQNNPSDPLNFQKEVRDFYKAEFDEYDTGDAPGAYWNGDRCIRAYDTGGELEVAATACRDAQFEYQSAVDEVIALVNSQYLIGMPTYLFRYTIEDQDVVEAVWICILEHGYNWEWFSSLDDDLIAKRNECTAAYAAIEAHIAAAEADNNITQAEIDGLAALNLTYHTKVDYYIQEVMNAANDQIASAKYFCDAWADLLNSWASDIRTFIALTEWNPM